jgi:hypothetical protein
VGWHADILAQSIDFGGGVTRGVLLSDVPVAFNLSSGISPKQFIRSEWFIGTALLTGAVWIACDTAGLSNWPAALISLAIGFGFRLTALFRGWEEPLAAEPAGVVIHKPHVLLGRKLHDKSQRELRDLGLDVAKAAPHDEGDNPRYVTNTASAPRCRSGGRRPTAPRETVNWLI